MVWKQKANLRGPRGASVQTAHVSGDNLVVTTDDGRTLVAGDVRGPRGLPGLESAPTDEGVGELVAAGDDSVTGRKLNDGYFARIGTELLGAALTRLRMGSATRIVVRGDSTVYGQDTVSADKVAPPAEPLPDGSTHTLTRSPSPWPSVLQARLSAVYGPVTVVNQGYSGDWVPRGFTRWTQNAGADITIISYGINDASSSGVPVAYRGDAGQYVDALEQMVLRDFKWGSGVIFALPTRQRGSIGTSSGKVIDAYRRAVYTLSSRYGIPIIELDTFLTNANRDAWSDDFHFNTKGYGIIGSRFAATMIGQGPAFPKHVGSGSKLLPRLLDGFVPTTSAVGALSGGYYTPNEDFAGQGSALALASGVTGTDVVLGYLPFYTDEPDVVVFPYHFVSGSADETGARLTYELDFGVEQGDNYHDHIIVPVNQGAQPGPPTSIATTPQVGVGNFYQRDLLAQSLGLRVSTPGWHVLTVKGSRSVTASTVAVMAFEFVGWREWQNARLGRAALHQAVPATFDESADITQTVVPYGDLLQRLGATPWTSHQYAAPMLKLTVRSYGVGVVQYGILVTKRPDNAGSDIAANAVGSTSGEGPASVHASELLAFSYTGNSSTPKNNSNGRELASIGYRASDQSVLLNWRTTNSADGAAKNMKRAFEMQITML